MQGDPLWAVHENHRRHIHTAIEKAAGRNDRTLALIGAGRCYDVDLAVLKGRFSEILLVDIDRSAVEEGMMRQGVQESGISCVAPFDVTGFDVATGTPDDQPDDTPVETWLKQLAVPPVLPFDGLLDGIVSQCVLSQLVLATLERFGEAHPRLAELVQALCAAHLRFLLQSVRQGGWVLLVCDVVASDTLPIILNGPFTHRTVARMAGEAFARGNYFTGVLPSLVAKSCETDSWLAGQNTRYKLHEPWIWNDAPDHARIVYAMTLWCNGPK